jgi:hypothetical protein
MGKFSIFFISVFIISTQLFSQLPDELMKELIKNNGVKSQTQWNYNYKNDKPEKEGYKNTYKEYNKHGNLIKEIYYRRGNVNQKMSYKYDENQNKTEFINYSAKNDEVVFKQEFFYNEKNLKIRENRYNGNDYFKIYYDYNDQDRLKKITKKKLVGTDKKLEEERIYTYKGDKQIINVLDDEGNKLSKIINTYDKNGNLTSFVTYDTEGKELKKLTYKYNENNQKTDEIKHQNGNFIYHKNFDYNKKGNLVEIQKEQPRENVHISKIYEYDTQGLVDKELRYDDMAEKYDSKKYFYGENGLLNRVIVYYALYDYKVMYKYNYNFY